jgi:hypothetical protein
MTQDEIIRMAREAGLITNSFGDIHGDIYHIERFADLVAAHERKRTKDLTDDEIDAIDNANWENDHKTWDIKKFARAVIVADREKNK